MSYSINLFKEITKIPRPSKHEAKMREFLIGKAKELNYPYQVDEAGNLLVKVAGKGAQANKPTVMLQGHMDMVTVANEGVTIDFFNDGLTIYEEDGYLKAKGTTLGADNGIGIAMAFYCAQLDNHPPLELLFTADEESGMSGAEGIKPGFFTADLAINLDSHEEGQFTVGCAGGGEVTFKIKAGSDSSFSSDHLFKYELKGLMGGHSGNQIHEKRASASLLIAHQLKKWQDNGLNLRVADINSGKFHNTIADAGYVVVAFAGADEAEKAGSLLITEISDYPDEKNYRQQFTKVSGLTPLSAEATTKVIALVNHLQHGVITWSKQFEGIVETSANLAIIKIKDGSIEVTYSCRSFIDSKVVEIQQACLNYAKEQGLEATHTAPYPGWAPAAVNPLADTMKAIYKGLTGKDAHTSPVHAGLECGFLLKVNPNLRAISMGPIIYDLHNPQERLDIASVDRAEALLKETMAKI